MSFALGILCYCIGAIPFGLLIGRARGVDIRESGSGNIGASNATRALGKKFGALVLLCDALKVYLPLTLIKHFAAPSAWNLAAIAFAAFIGHIFSPWLGFRGGKGVASGFGVYLALLPLYAALAAVTWAFTFAWRREASLASLAATYATTLAVIVRVHAPPLQALALAMALLITLRHAENIRRLVAGKELKF